MKRSEINKALKELEAMCAKYKCYLPPFCNFTPEEWQEKGHEYDEVRDCMLGWDITDYGLGNFDKFGFSLITIRNGCRTQPEKYPKVYAEKLLYLKEGQMAANHFHWFKTEDIINRGGGNCLIRVYNSLPNEEIDYESDVEVHRDGLKRMVPAGTQIRLRAAAVADGDEGEPEFVKIAEAEIRDIPAEHTVAHFIVFMALRLPLPGREVTEWRQIALVFFAHGLQLPERFVDLRTFHNTSATG